MEAINSLEQAAQYHDKEAEYYSTRNGQLDGIPFGLVAHHHRLHAAAIRKLPNGWQPISTVRELDRVIVAGWSKPTAICRGYWWYHDDFICDGKPSEHPEATMWHPFPPMPPEPEVNL